MHLITGTKKTFSARELQRQLGHKFYKPVWHLPEKFRATSPAMGSYNDQQCKTDTPWDTPYGFRKNISRDI
jgi:hypothetical protein